LSDELVAFFADLDFEKLRINRPSKFVFLCGGQTIGSARSSLSLRDYIYRTKKLQKRVNANVLLAEKAIQIYRETDYSDLISFEEDIATISSVVLLIAESAGSLTELGAFSTNATIRKSLRVIAQQKYAKAESFIRYGPIERIIKAGNRNFVGYYPWRVTPAGRFVRASARLHYDEIQKFITDHLDAVPDSELYRLHTERQPFYVIYWIIYLSLAISVSDLYACAILLMPKIGIPEIRNKLYCMELAGWISRTSYSGKDYFFVLHEHDPFDYAFRSTVSDRDSTRRKFIVAEALSKESTVPSHVRKSAREARRKRPSWA
jgi:hypothetical protein